MEVVTHRAALLSNYEVLSLLRELENDHLLRTKTAVRIRKEEEGPGHPPRVTGGEKLFGEASENLRTIEVEAIQYLSADYLPTQRQSPEGITKLIKSLAPYELTKGEKLQIVNLAPTLPVELYVIVEELEDRLGERMDEILSRVQSSLSAIPAEPTDDVFTGGTTYVADNAEENYVAQRESIFPEENDQYPEDIDYDDTGEGAGVEGDLDVEED